MVTQRGEYNDTLIADRSLSRVASIVALLATEIRGALQLCRVVCGLSGDACRCSQFGLAWMVATNHMTLAYGSMPAGTPTWALHDTGNADYLICRWRVL